MRRGFLTRRTAMMSGLAAAACVEAPAPAPERHFDLRLVSIEARTGGRLGVAALDTQTGAWLTHRPDDRFAMCSTFKPLLAAQALDIAARLAGYLEQPVQYSAADLIDPSPVTRANLERGSNTMTIEQLCAAAVEQSDNAAANLLLRSLSGPQGLTNFLRANGDDVTRLDRTEPSLNENAPGDPRDTTTPRAMAAILQRLLLGESVLNQNSRAKLIDWMRQCQTGLTRLRAGLPQSWRAGDKTGASSGDHNACNDVAIAFPPGRAPILIASYLTESRLDADARNAAHGDVARAIAETWS